MSDREKKLIEKVRQNDDRALIELFSMYHPIVEKSRNRFFFRGFDKDDWDQETLLICHEAALTYNSDKGSFGTFFRCKLNHWCVSLLRYQNAERRLGDDQNCSLDLLIEGGEFLNKRDNIWVEVLTPDGCIEYLEKLSENEFLGFQYLLGKYTSEELKKLKGINPEQLKRACARAYKKLTATLYKD